MRDASESNEESQKSINAVLDYANLQRIPLINYISSIFNADTHDHCEHSQGFATPYGRFEICHHYNEAALRSFGACVRVFRLPVLSDDPSHPWLQWLYALSQFKQDIEDRVPGYFARYPLRVNVSRGVTPILSTEQAVEAIVEISEEAAAGVRSFDLLNPRSVSLESYFPAIEQTAGIKLVSVNKDSLGPIDELFGRRIEEFLRYLTVESVPPYEDALQYSPSLRALATQAPEMERAVFDGMASCKAKDDGKSEKRSRTWGLMKKRCAVAADGTVLHYYAGGTGTPLVLLNAFGQGFGYWTRFLAEVLDEYRLILWLPRGSGFESVGLQNSSPLSVHADDLDVILNQEEIHSCHVLAWCTGPKLALEYWMKYPRAVASLIFVAGSFKGLSEHRSVETSYEKGLESLLALVRQQPQVAGLMIDALKNVLLAQSTQSATETKSDSGPRQQELLASVNSTLKDLVTEPFSNHKAVLAYAEQLHHFWNTNFSTALKTIRVPVLFVGGDCDRIASQEISKGVARMMPESRYAEVAGGSHYIQHSYPELLAGMVKSFIDDGLRFSYQHPWVRTCEVNAQDQKWRIKNDREDNDRRQNQTNVPGDESAPVASQGAGVC